MSVTKEEFAMIRLYILEEAMSLIQRNEKPLAPGDDDLWRNGCAYGAREALGAICRELYPYDPSKAYEPFKVTLEKLNTARRFCRGILAK